MNILKTIYAERRKPVSVFGAECSRRWRQERGGTRSQSDREPGTSGPGPNFSPEGTSSDSVFIQRSRLEQVRWGESASLDLPSTPGAASPLQCCQWTGPTGGESRERGGQPQLCCEVWTTHFSFLSPTFCHPITAEKAAQFHFSDICWWQRGGKASACGVWYIYAT